MSIALFDGPPRISISASHVSSRVGLLMGLAITGHHNLHGIVILEDGGLTLLDLDEFITDYKYDPEKDRWVGSAEEQE